MYVSAAGDDRVRIARRRPAASSASAKRPKHGGPRAADGGAERACVARAPERRRRAPDGARAPRARGRSRAPRASRAGPAAASVAERARVEAGPRVPPQPVELGVDLGGGQAVARAAPAPAMSGGSATGSTLSPAPVHEGMRGLDLARHVGAERAASARSAAASSGCPASPLAARSAAAASALPPPSPAATGIRLWIAQLERGERAAGAPRGTRRAPRRRGSSPSTPGQSDAVRAGSRGLGRELVGELERGEQRAERVQAVRRGGPTWSTRLSFARGARSRSLCARRRPRAARARARWPAASSRSGAQPLGARVRRMAHPLERGARAVADPAAARRARAPASRPAPCGGGRSRRARARTQSSAAPAPRRRSATSAESTFGTGWKTRARHPAQDADLARELGEHRGRAIRLAPGRGGEPLAHLALDHRDPEPRPGSSAIDLSSTVAATP